MPTYLTHDDVEPIVEQIANRELDVPRDGTKLEIQVGSHPCVVFRDTSRRGITIAHARGKVLARIKSPVCRWCAGLGLHPHLPPRTAQCFTVDRRLVGDEPKGPNGIYRNIVEVMGVQHNWPLRLWWSTAERKDPEYLTGLPPYDSVCCPRCNGEGY